MTTVAGIVEADAGVLGTFVERPGASLFTSLPWVSALAATYGFTAEAMCAGDSALLFARVDDLRGPRAISYPFSDYCDPQLQSPLHWQAIADGLVDLELPVSLRLLHSTFPGHPRFSTEEVGLWHAADLTRPVEQMWSELAGPARQNARRAERDGVTVRLSTAMDDVATFHRLHCDLRRTRYGMLAQPTKFFEELHEQFFSRDQGFVLLAEDDGDPVAGLFLLQSGLDLYYKFNASTDRGSRPNDLLAWHAMKEGHLRGLRSLDFGFSDLSQPGLHRFKRKYATEEKTVVAVRHVPEGWDPDAGLDARTLLSGLTEIFTDPLVPHALSSRAGNALYRYFC